MVSALFVLAGVAWLTETLGISKPILMYTVDCKLRPPIVVVTVVAHALRVMLKRRMRASKNLAAKVLRAETLVLGREALTQLLLCCFNFLVGTLLRLYLVLSIGNLLGINFEIEFFI